MKTMQSTEGTKKHDTAEGYFGIAKKLAEISLGLRRIMWQRTDRLPIGVFPEDYDEYEEIRRRLDETRDRVVESGVAELSGNDPLATPIMEMGLSARAQKLRNKLGIRVAGQLELYTSDELLEVRNFGKGSLQAVRMELAKLGLKLEGD